MVRVWARVLCTESSRGGWRISAGFHYNDIGLRISVGVTRRYPITGKLRLGFQLVKVEITLGLAFAFGLWEILNENFNLGYDLVIIETKYIPHL